mgnify:CR=1 FL=1
MKIMEPRGVRNGRQMTWTISKESRVLVSAYADYAHCSEDEVVDTTLRLLLCDKDFVAEDKKKRNNRRITEALATLGEVKCDQSQAARKADG